MHNYREVCEQRESGKVLLQHHREKAVSVSYWLLEFIRKYTSFRSGVRSENVKHVSKGERKSR